MSLFSDIPPPVLLEGEEMYFVPMTMHEEILNLHLGAMFEMVLTEPDRIEGIIKVARNEIMRLYPEDWMEHRKKLDTVLRFHRDGSRLIFLDKEEKNGGGPADNGSAI